MKISLMNYFIACKKSCSQIKKNFVNAYKANIDNKFYKIHPNFKNSNIKKN